MKNKSNQKLEKLFNKDTIVQQEYEEKLGKQIIIDLYTTKFVDFATLDLNKMSAIRQIHTRLFSQLFAYAGKIRNISYAKNELPFLPHRYLNSGIEYFDAMPSDSIDAIVKKYIEYNYIPPFYEGNGRVGRIWLDAMLFKREGKVVSWENISPPKYLRLMHQTRKDPDNYSELKSLIEQNLIKLQEVNYDQIFRGTDLSYAYEGLNKYKTLDIYYRLKGN